VNRSEGEVLKYREARARTWAKSEPVGANDPKKGLISTMAILYLTI
jgi:hypothetical protein